MEKKGLSNVVATVLIVLLALAAVAIVWGFINPSLQRGGAQIDTASKCLNTELTATSCLIAPDFDNSGRDLSTVIVKLNRGDPDKIRLVFKDNEGNSILSESRNPPTNTLETARIEGIDLTDPDFVLDGSKVTIVAVFSDEQGEEAFCEESPIEFTCQIVLT